MAGIYLGHADRMSLVAAAETVSLWVWGFAAWLVVFVDVMRHLWRTVFASGR